MSFLSHGLFGIIYLALPAGPLNTPGVMVAAQLPPAFIMVINLGTKNE